MWLNFYHLVKDWNFYSRFWLGNNFYPDATNAIQLANIQRAITNFVTILTGEKINIKFSTKATTGKTQWDDIGNRNIILPATPDIVDVISGLALHEGAHIILTDIEISRKIKNSPKKYFDTFIQSFKIKHKNQIITDSITDEKIIDIIYNRINCIWNWVEDRRIDDWVIKHAPGYIGYYESLYEYYFKNKSIDQEILSENFRDESYKSYKFRFINLLNDNTDLDALKGLRELSDILDIQNINRLKSHEDSLKLAMKLYECIDKYYIILPNDNSKEDSTNNNEQPKNDNDNSNDDSKESDTSHGQDDLESNTNNSQSNQLTNAIDKQEKFTNGQISKIHLPQDIFDELKLFEKNNVLVKNIKIDDANFEVIVINKLTLETIKQNTFKIFDTHPKNQVAINKGIILGTMLGRKLQIRDEIKITKFNRQEHGILDKKMLHTIPFNDKIFYHTSIDQFKRLSVHISVDGSGSMNGDKWIKTQIAVVAIAKAASMIENLDIIISYRYSSMSPITLIAYDSRIDKFKKIQLLFGYLKAYGATPEALCFESIKKIILSNSIDCEKYFINFSDGQPSFSNYEGPIAVEHTSKMIKLISSSGIKILSYYISSQEFNISDIFKSMYGKFARFINVNNIIELANSLNQMFLTKNE